MEDVVLELKEEAAQREARLACPLVPLFGSGQDYDTQAWIEELGPGDTAEADGFKDAAQALIKLVRSGKEYPDTLVFPIVFCYRHFLELSLKTIVRQTEACKYLSSDTKEINDALSKHDLQKLWTLILQGLERCGQANEPTIVRVGERIQEWHQYDPSSFAYRYSRSKKGDKRRVPPDGPHVNLLNFTQGMDDLAFTLEMISEMYEKIRDYQSEMEAEFGVQG